MRKRKERGRKTIWRNNSRKCSELHLIYIKIQETQQTPVDSNRLALSQTTIKLSKENRILKSARKEWFVT